MPSRKPAIVARLLEVIRMIRVVRRRHHDQRQLAAMSERELRDLGVGRSQIPGLLKPLA